MENSKISWTDHTFNGWIGCTKVSPGCFKCYAETLDFNRFSKTLGGGTKEAPVIHWGKGAPRHRTSQTIWNDPVRWNKIAEAGRFVEVTRAGAFIARGDIGKLVKQRDESGRYVIQEGDRVVPVRPRVFCASLSDWLDDEVPIEWLADLLALILATPHLDWLLLTKRPENWGPRISAVHRLNWDSATCTNSTPLGVWLAKWATGMPELIPANVWIGTSVEDQTRADERIPALLRIPARVRFLSCEPLLGQVVLPIGQVMQGFPKHITAAGHAVGAPLGIHWVIVGGESGTDARPMHPDWARSLRDQCAAAGVAFHFKQWGEWAPTCVDIMPGNIYLTKSGDQVVEGDAGYEESVVMERFGKAKAGRLLDGIEHNAFPVVEVAKSFLERIPTLAYVALVATQAYYFIAGALDALPPVP